MDNDSHLSHYKTVIYIILQPNALKAITPATLDVLLKILSSNEHDRPTNEQRLEMLALKDLVLKCAVRMVHVIHCCSPDQVMC